MCEKYIIITRHGDTDKYNNLTKEGINNCVLKGVQILQEIGINFSENVFIILCSPVERITESVKNICNGMNIKNPNINIIEGLSEEYDFMHNKETIKTIKEMINNYLYILIVTHGPNCFSLSFELGGKCKFKELKFLESYNFKVNNNN